MPHDYLKFVIVGHVDHGKSTLIGRLLYDTKTVPQEKIEEVKTVCAALGKPFEFCYLMDYMEEEREKNITIDTTQTFFKTDQRDYVIIDAPGHKEFLKNMITGSSLADAALLIVDAHEGVKEQTKRHAHMLKLLNVNQLILLMNKMDLVDYDENRFNTVKEEILNHLNILGLKPLQIIPISGKEGDNIANKSANLPWYHGPTVLESLDSLKPLRHFNNLPLRLPVQDLYQINGETVVVGQIESGALEKNQEVIIFPAGVKNQVLTVKKWQHDLDRAEVGHSVGIILNNYDGLKRGQIICETHHLPITTNEITATIFWLNDKSLKLGERFILKCVTQELPAQIKKIHKIMNSSTLELISGRDDEIKTTEVAEVIIETSDKIVVDPFTHIPEMGRFVLEKDGDIAGGGTINNTSN